MYTKLCVFPDKNTIKLNSNKEFAIFRGLTRISLNRLRFLAVSHGTLKKTHGRQEYVILIKF